MYGDGVCATINGGYEAVLVRTQANSTSAYKQYCFAFIPILETVAYSPALYLLIYCAKASYAQSHDIPLRSDTQALRLIARIPHYPAEEKCYSREDKSAFP